MSIREGGPQCPDYILKNSDLAGFDCLWAWDLQCLLD